MCILNLLQVLTAGITDEMFTDGFYHRNKTKKGLNVSKQLMGTNKIILVLFSCFA